MVSVQVIEHKSAVLGGLQVIELNKALVSHWGNEFMILGWFLHCAEVSELESSEHGRARLQRFPQHCHGKGENSRGRLHCQTS